MTDARLATAGLQVAVIGTTASARLTNLGGVASVVGTTAASRVAAVATEVAVAVDLIPTPPSPIKAVGGTFGTVGGALQ